jgi:cobaltochelatase CobN
MIKKFRKRTIIFAIIDCALILGAIFFAWSRLLSPTRIAFVNYQAITLGQISKANTSSFVKITNLELDDLKKVDHYDMVFVNGMGLRLTEEQRTILQEAADHGTPMLSTAVTNPQNYIVSVDSIDAEFLKQYLNGANRSNYHSLLSYVRKYIDGKKLFVEEPKDPTASVSSLLYHLDPAHPKDEELAFASVGEYEQFLKKNKLYNAEAPRIILTGQMGVPDELIAQLEAAGNMVYPVNAIQSFIKEGHADSLKISAVINMAHGRMGDEVVTYLTAHNIPLFAPLNVNTTYDSWMADTKGMSGGFLSQSVVTPEIDGAIRPFSLFAHYEGSDGLPYVAPIPDRLKEFVATVQNYLNLQRKPNAQKKVAIFYFKGPGQNALVAEGMEVAPSLYHLLCRLKSEGYRVEHLPASAAELEAQLNANGRVFNNYAIGAQADFIASAHPQLVKKADYDRWIGEAMPKEMLQEINEVDGPFPGHGLHTNEGDLALARLQFGNVVLIPQTAAGAGSDDFKVVHGTDMAPPHAYVASYLWARYGFQADALMHFGAHGSLEFTPRKQVALSSRDWSDRLVGTMPHFYVYSTSNVGEAMMAKRRSYAAIINYLTPPFLESNVRTIYSQLSEAINTYNKLAAQDQPNAAAVEKASLAVKKLTVQLGIHRELRLDSVMSKPYSEEEVARIEGFAEELANEKITGKHYVLGEPYEDASIQATVLAMTADPVAYSLFALDRTRGKASADLTKHKALFTERYVRPARALISKLLASHRVASDADLCALAGITTDELKWARETEEALNSSKDLFSRMMVMGSSMPSPKPTAKLKDRAQQAKPSHPKGIPGMSPEVALAMAKKMGADEAALKKMEAAMKKGKSKGGSSMGGGHAEAMKAMGITMAPELTEAQRAQVNAIMEVQRAVQRVDSYREALKNSPEAELASVVNGLNGGYIAPTSGGDPILNPNVLPTGRNMFAVNAEETPSAAAWEKGKTLAENTLAMYRKNHNDSLPRKVSYTLWSSEFIETEGATIAQVLYMLGVEPVRDPFGRVSDIRLIPSKELGRPRIDVVVQTSGQLRDLAASRLFLINRAVQMAAEAKDKEYDNFVAQGVVDSERHLVSKGVTPKEARELSTARVFGGVNGNYGSGIQEMVEAGDRWENESEIAETYMNNMGAFYGSEEDWEKMREFAFEAALTNTEVVVQPRQSNTWGALSLDHVYEFMGGMNLAVRNVTGKDPEAYLSDYRNRNNVKMQEVKEAIGVESRTTILNPTYIKEKMKGGAGDANTFADVVRNTYGWNVMKPAAIDNELWDDIYDTYVQDKQHLGTKEFFTSKNPAALEEVTAVMLETVRKGMWKATDEQIAAIAELHTEIVNQYQPSCSGFVCNNPKLREFIASKVDASTAKEYHQHIAQIRAEAASADDGMVMKKEELNQTNAVTSVVNGVIVAVVVLVALVGIFLLVKRRRKMME